MKKLLVKIKDFCIKHKKVILKGLLIVAIIGALALGIYGLMCLLGVNTIEGLQNVVNSYGFGAYLIIIALQVIQVVFIPISNQIITIPAIAVVGVWNAFFCSWIGIEVGTIILYLIGRFSGGKLLQWLLSDKEKADKFTKLVKSRKLFYPVGMLIGVIPDDLLTTVAGVSKMNFWYVLVVSILTRGVCTLTTCFGFGILTQTWWGIVLLVIGIIIICVIGYLFLRYEPQIEQHFVKDTHCENCIYCEFVIPDDEHEQIRCNGKNSIGFIAGVDKYCKGYKRKR